MSASIPTFMLMLSKSTTQVRGRLLKPLGLSCASATLNLRRVPVPVLSPTFQPVPPSHMAGRCLLETRQGYGVACTSPLL